MPGVRAALLHLRTNRVDGGVGQQKGWAAGKLVSAIEAELYNYGNREVPVQVIGELVMDRLKALDKVAYIRFASVYREFTDLKSFEKELRTLKKN